MVRIVTVFACIILAGIGLLHAYWPLACTWLWLE